MFDNFKLLVNSALNFGHFFPFELLSDPDEKVCKAFDVMKLKSMYGREYIGVDRSTFLIDKEGKILKEWRSVKVKGHVEEVLNTVKDLT